MIDWGYVVAAAIVCEMVILVVFHRDTHWPSRSGADVLAERDDVEDLVDHLDPTNSFEFDIGGEG